MERLQDFEDKVRSRAIIAICEAAIAHPEVTSTNYCRTLFLLPLSCNVLTTGDCSYGNSLQMRPALMEL